MELVGHFLDSPVKGVPIVELLRDKGRQFKQTVIAKAAYELFITYPFESVTVDDIAEKAACGKGTLYRYFPSKDQILTFVISARLEDVTGAIEAQCLNNKNTLLAINNYFTLQYSFFLKNSLLMSSWLRRSQDASFSNELLEEVNNRLENKLKMAATLLERGMKENMVITVDSHELARLLENIIRDSTISLFANTTRGHDPERVLKLIKIIVSDGILINNSIADL